MTLTVPRSLPPNPTPRSIADTVNQILGTIFGTSGVREVLTANRTYYVRTDAADSNDGLSNSATGAFKTLQAAVNAYAKLDTRSYSVTLQVADGTYTAGVIVSGPEPGSAQTPLTIQGNTSTPANCIISTTSANCLAAVNGAVVYITGFQLKTTTSGDCLIANTARITYGVIDFNTCAGFHKEANNHGQILNNGDYTISGNAVAHQHCTNLSYMLNLSCTVTLTGTPAFSSFFDGVSLGGSIQYVSCTFSGSATGQRFLAHDAGTILASGQADTYLPGNAVGVRDTGGQFIGTNGGTAYLTQGAQWSTSNYGLNLAIGGGRHNAFGIRDATGANPWAIANVSGVLTFAQMEAFYGVAAAPTQRFELLANGTGRFRGFTVANLPAAPLAGSISYATNGRKAGEGAGLGTGVLVFADSAATWIAVDTGAAVAA